MKSCLQHNEVVSHESRFFKESLSMGTSVCSIASIFAQNTGLEIPTPIHQIDDALPSSKRERRNRATSEIFPKREPDENLNEPLEEDLAFSSEKNSKKSPELNYHSKKISKNISRAKNELRRHYTRQTWKRQEDKFAIEQVKLYGLNWGLISHNMEGKRSGKQIRDRYLNKLHPSINNSKWTEVEDQQLLYLFKLHGRK